MWLCSWGGPGSSTTAIAKSTHTAQIAVSNITLQECRTLEKQPNPGMGQGRQKECLELHIGHFKKKKFSKHDGNLSKRYRHYLEKGLLLSQNRDNMTIKINNNRL